MSISKYLAVILLSVSSVAWSWNGLVREGGVSGGGGNILDPQYPSDVLDSESAEHLIKASHLYTQIFFRKAHEQFANQSVPAELQPVYEKIFAGEKDIHEVLSSVRPHVRDDGPCYDSSRRPVDASVVTRSPDRFCVSSFNVARKVEAPQIPVQAAALMAHEYTEIMGLGEDEAVMVQRQALKDLQSEPLPPLKPEDDGYDD